MQNYVDVEDDAEWQQQQAVRAQMRDAAVAGHLALLQEFVDNGHALPQDLVAAAAVEGHMDVIEWLLQQGLSMSQDVLLQAAANGHLELCQFCLNHGTRVQEETFRAAISKDLDGVVEWLAERLQEAVDWNRLLAHACIIGCAKCFKWLYERRGYTRDDLQAVLASAGSVHRTTSHRGQAVILPCDKDAIVAYAEEHGLLQPLQQPMQVE